jgi:glycosyltransferase involved in cell wall biosynthesis
MLYCRYHGGVALEKEETRVAVELNAGAEVAGGSAPEFSVVIPVYNSEQTLEPLVSRLSAVFRALRRSYEIILTDDGSRDGSWGVIEALHARGEPIRAFRFMRNHGQQYALKCGLDHCQGRYAITMDDDLQHPPEEIPRLIEALEADPEVDVASARYQSKQHSLFRNLGSWLNERMVQLVFRIDPGVQLESFAIFRANVTREIQTTRYARPNIELTVLSVTNRIRSVTVNHVPRAVGRSQYTLRKLMADHFDCLLNYSVLPLRVLSWSGMIGSLITVLAAVYFLTMRALGLVEVSGFTAIVLAVLFCGGMILFSMGIVGEYLERIIHNQTNFAQYHVRTVLERPRAPESASPGARD